MVKRIPPSPPFFQYQPWQRGPWLGFNWRYDSGLVAGAVPVADGLGTVDLSGLTGGQELQAGLFCGSAHPTLSTPLGTCTSGYGSTLNSLTSPEKEKDDSNPPRVSPPRKLSDLAVGDDNFSTENATNGASLVDIGNTRGDFDRNPVAVLAWILACRLALSEDCRRRGGQFGASDSRPA
jgi:hypothetical protein